MMTSIKALTDIPHRISLTCSAAEIIECALRTAAAGFSDADVHQSLS